MQDLSLKKKGAKGEFLVNKVFLFVRLKYICLTLYLQLQDILYDDVFFKYAAYQAVTDVVADIVGPNISAAHSMLINKPPDADASLSKHPLHQVCSVNCLSLQCFDFIMLTSLLCLTLCKII